MDRRNSELANGIRASADLQEIVSEVAMAIKLVDRADLRRAMRAFAGVSGDQSIRVRFPSGGGVEVRADGGVEPRHGDQLASARSLDDFVWGDAEISRLIHQAHPAAIAKACEIVAPIFVPGHLPSRAEFASFRRWAPLVALSAYRLAARFIDELESWRGAARREAAAEARGDTVIARYYSLVHTLAHLMLTCSASEPSGWLADRAKALAWTNWTPTAALVRERTVWLAAAAAKTAVAFGPGVIDPYLRALERADHAMEAIDALLALVAIGLTHDEARDEIEREIRRRQEALDDVLTGRDHVRHAVKSALDTLGSPRSGEADSADALKLLRWRPDAPSGLATAPAFRLDATDPAPSGPLLVFVVLPTILRASGDRHYPLRTSSPSPLLPKLNEMHGLLLQAWGPPLDRTLH